MGNTNGKRIAKNTMILYIRMVVMILIALYTSRVLLKLLGVIDFGVYNVVAGIVEFATIFTGTMTAATQRFLSFDLGRLDIRAFNESFCSIYNIFILLCVLMMVVLIPVGIWMIYDFLVIPDDRQTAAIYVLICSVIAFVLSTLAIPYMSAIIAYERMDVFAYISIAETVSKLLSAVLLFYVDGDKLVYYAIALLGFRILLNIVIAFYCKAKLPGCKYHLIWNYECIRKIAAFSGWSTIGATSNILMTQGHSVLLNVFFGPLVNAAKAISDRVKNFALMLAQNVFIAVTPQITKSYSVGNLEYSRKLVSVSSRLSFLLLFVACAPIVLEMKPILSLWLGAEYVTDDAVMFSVNCILFALLTTLEAPLTKMVQATGEVRNYELFVGFVTLVFIPLSYLALCMKCDAVSTFVILNVLYLLIMVYRIHCVSKIIHITYLTYVKEVLLPIAVSLVAFGSLVYVLETYVLYSVSWLVKVACWYVLALLAIIPYGLMNEEKKTLMTFVVNKIKKYDR